MQLCLTAVMVWYFFNLMKPYWSIANFRATLGHKLNHSFNAKTRFAPKAHSKLPSLQNSICILIQDNANPLRKLYIGGPLHQPPLIPDPYGDRQGF